jgi:hypothetical protein
MDTQRTLLALILIRPEPCKRSIWLFYETMLFTSVTMKKFLKYCGISLAILLLIWVLSIAVVHFLMKAEHIRKFATTAVSENTSGEISLGEIKLHVFPLVHFEINDIVFNSSSNFNKNEIFGCKKAELSFNLFKLIMGKPVVKLHLETPTVNFISNGKTNNIVDVFQGGKKADKKDKGKTPAVLTYLLTHKFIIDINDAGFKYTTTKRSFSLSGLNFDMGFDPGLKGIALIIDTHLDYKKLDVIISGDAKLFLQAKFESKDNTKIRAELDATKLLIRTGGIEKKNGDLFKLAVLAETEQQTKIILKDMTVYLIDEFLDVNGSIANFMNESPGISLNMTISKKFDVSNLSKIITSLKNSKMSGTLEGNASFKGPLFVVNAEFKYVDDINKNSVTLKVSNTGKNRRLMYVDIFSPDMNLNPYLPPKGEVKVAKATETAKAQSQLKIEETAQAENLAKAETISDEDIIARRKINIRALKKAFHKYTIELNSKINRMLYRDMELNNFVLAGLFNKDELTLNKLNAQLLQGALSGNLKIGLAGDDLSCSGKINIKGIQVKDAAAVFVPSIRGVINGNASSDLEFTASGYSAKSVKRSLVAKGNFTINDFVYSSDELRAVMNKELADKLAEVTSDKNKQVLKNDPGWETLQGTYNIKDEKINIEKLFAKEGEYELTGKGVIGFDESINIYVDLVIPYKDFAYEPVRMGERKDKSMLAVHLTGTIVKPNFDKAYTVGYITAQTIQHVPKAVTGAVVKGVKGVGNVLQRIGEGLISPFTKD